MKEKILNIVIDLFKVKTIITLATSALFIILSYKEKLPIETTIITLATSALFIILSYKEKLPIETTTMVIGMVFTYYFNKDNNKI